MEYFIQQGADLSLDEDIKLPSLSDIVYRLMKKKNNSNNNREKEKGGNILNKKENSLIDDLHKKLKDIISDNTTQASKITSKNIKNQIKTSVTSSSSYQSFENENKKMKDIISDNGRINDNDNKNDNENNKENEKN